MDRLGSLSAIPVGRCQAAGTPDRRDLMRLLISTTLKLPLLSHRIYAALIRPLVSMVLLVVLCWRGCSILIVPGLVVKYLPDQHAAVGR